MVRALLLEVHAEIAAVITLNELKILIIAQMQEGNERDPNSELVLLIRMKMAPCLLHHGRKLDVLLGAAGVHGSFQRVDHDRNADRRALRLQPALLEGGEIIEIDGFLRLLCNFMRRRNDRKLRGWYLCEN